MVPTSEIILNFFDVQYRFIDKIKSRERKKKKLFAKLTSSLMSIPNDWFEGKICEPEEWNEKY